MRLLIVVFIAEKIKLSFGDGTWNPTSPCGGEVRSPTFTRLTVVSDSNDSNFSSPIIPSRCINGQFTKGHS